MDKLIPNSTQFPNIILDFLLPKLPEAETKCLLYICRRTFGFHRDEDRISFTQFIYGIKSREGKILDSGTGLSRTSVNSALKSLSHSGAILINKSSKGNLYRINLKMDIRQVVQNLNQYRIQTASSLKSKPKQVRIFDLQKKEKKEKIDFSNQNRGQDVEKQKSDRRYAKLQEVKNELIRKKIIH